MNNAQSIAAEIKSRGNIRVRFLRGVGDDYSAGQVVTLDVLPDTVHGTVLVAMGAERKPFPLSTLVGRGFVERA